MTTPAAVQARGIVKAFPGVLANDNVDLDLWRGGVHAILGENGAGKSTLAAVLAGLYRPDAGSLLIDGEAATLNSPRDGLARGIGMVHQHFRLIERFTVAENVALGDHRQPLFLSTTRIESDVAALGERFGLPIDARARVADLSVGERQRVEIVKTLYRGAEVLLLDEPTAVLTPQEVEALFATVRAMADDGKAVAFISHKLGEVLAISDRITVMRDGRVIGSVATAEADEHTLARMMVGRDVDLSARRASQAPGASLLDVAGITVTDGGATVLDDVSFTVRAGETLGVAGVAGNGQVALAECIAGLHRPTSGRVMVGGRDVTRRGPREARAAGLAYVPEDRLGTGLAPSLTITENLLLTRRRGFLLNRRRAATEARQLIRRFDIKAPGPGTATRVLSGGNAQKVLLARELSASPPPKVLLTASPTRGLDVGATETVRDLLTGFRAAGAAVVLISEDLDEVRALADRIVVLYRGRLVYEATGATADVDALGLAMAGSHP
ncbi:MAG: ABC transporter ATP-binding protein [Acidimicrobiales bacterium]